MIEVIHHGNGWRWRWINAAGRTLIECFESHPCDIKAWNAAKAYRSAFWANADSIDHRQARCL